MSDVLPYRTMAYNNAWANHRLLTACLGLSLDEFIAKRTGFFPSLRATLNHILIIDHFYVDAMEGGTLGPAAFAAREPCSTVAALKEAQAAVDRRLLKVIEALDSAGLQRVVSVHRGTSIQRERMDRLLLHLFQHDVHHRGQAHSMLSGTAVSPPQLDEFFAVGEVPLVPVMAAVANAIYNALGKRFYALPMSPPKVLEVIDAPETRQAAE